LYASDFDTLIKFLSYLILSARLFVSLLARDHLGCPITGIQSTVGKKISAVHFTTTPCKPNTAYMAQWKPNFYNICPCTKDIE